MIRRLRHRWNSLPSNSHKLTGDKGRNVADAAFSLSVDQSPLQDLLRRNASDIHRSQRTGTHRNLKCRSVEPRKRSRSSVKSSKPSARWKIAGDPLFKT
jgi:hypothetical protein